MKIRPVPFKLPESDIYANDYLDRKPTIEILAELFRQSETDMVLSVTAPWGYGKTTYLKLLRAHLGTNGFPTISINAWEIDFINNPLVVLISEIEKFLTETSSEIKRKATFNKVKRLGIAVLKESIPAAVKIATYGVLDLDKITEDTIARAGEQIAKSEIERFAKEKEYIRSFRAQLGEFTSNLISEGTEKRPLIILLDELDRCRPSFAIEFLEVAKHLFNVRGVIFVLALDKDQLSESLRVLYGEKFDSAGYLRRFFDIEFSLPEPPLDKFIHSALHSYGVKQLMDRRTHPAFNESISDIQETFAFLGRVFSCSLRDIEQMVARLHLVFKTTPENQYIYIEFTVFLLFLHHADSSNYRAYRDGVVSTGDLTGLMLERVEPFEAEEVWYRIEAFLRYFDERKEMKSAFISSEDEYLSSEGNRSNPDFHKRERVRHLMSYFSAHRYSSQKSYITRKIDLLENFVG